MNEYEEKRRWDTKFTHYFPSIANTLPAQCASAPANHNELQKIVDFLTPPNLITQSNKLYSLIFAISMVVKKNINGKEINEIDLIEVNRIQKNIDQHEASSVLFDIKQQQPIM